MIETYFLSIVAITALIMFILAPIVYFKIVRKLDQVDPSLKYALPVLLPPIAAQLGRGLHYSAYILANSRKYRNLQGKVMGELHFRKYCSTIDVVLSYLYVISTVVMLFAGFTWYLVFEL